MQKPKNKIQQIFVLGAKSELSFNEKRDIIFNNQSIFLLILVFSFVVLVDLISGYFTRSWVPVFCILAILPGFYLQHLEKYTIYKIWTLACPLLGLAISSILFGGQANIYFYALPIMVMGMLLFRTNRQHLLIVFCHLAIFGSLHLHSLYVQPVLSGHDSAMIGFVHLLMVMFVTYIGLNQYAKHYNRYESRFIQLLEDVKEKNDND